MNHPVHHSLKAAYSFYNVHTVTPLLDLMSDALILAKSVSLPTSIVRTVMFPFDVYELHLFFLSLYHGFSHRSYV